MMGTGDDLPDTGAVYPDAHGEAALLLVESLIHGLIAAGALTTADAVEIVETAAEVKIALADERGAEPELALRSAASLDAIANSLRTGGGG